MAYTYTSIERPAIVWSLSLKTHIVVYQKEKIKNLLFYSPVGTNE